MSEHRLDKTTFQGITLRVFLLTLPLRRAIPVGSAMWTRRQVVLLRGEDPNGRTAWGEAAPLDGYGPDSLNEVRSALSNMLRPSQPLPPSLACALGTVRAGLSAAANQTSEGLFGGKTRLNELTPAALMGDSESVSGYSAHVKVKVGRQGPKADIDRVLAVRAAHPDVRIRLDGNGLYDREQAMQLVNGLGDVADDIEYFEEPWRDCFQNNLRGKLPLPVAIDESRVDENWQHADVCVLKPSLMGDPESTLGFARDIQGTGRRVVVSSAFESRVGMIMISWLAACIGDAAPGLGTYQSVADDWGGRSGLWDRATVAMSQLPLVPAPSGGEALPAGFRMTSESGLDVEEIL